MRYREARKEPAVMSEKTPVLSPLERAQATEVLAAAPIAYLSVADEGPYVVPICFAYEDAGASGEWGRVLIHTGEGRKTRALALDPRVCVAVVAEAAFEQGPEPCRDTFSFRSVLIEGTAVLLSERDERERALRTIVAKYDPGAAGHPFAETDFRVTLVYAINIGSLSYLAQPARQ